MCGYELESSYPSRVFNVDSLYGIRIQLEKSNCLKTQLLVAILTQNPDSSMVGVASGSVSSVLAGQPRTSFILGEPSVGFGFHGGN